MFASAMSAETAAPAAPAKKSPGHRGQDVRDTVAEMAAKAHEISLEAGSKMAAAMKEVVGAAAGLQAFSLESARDLVQYMVRRGQMTQDEADKLVRSAEDAWVKKHKGKLPSKAAAAASGKHVVSPFTPGGSLTKDVLKKVAARKTAGATATDKKPAAKKTAKKPAAKKPAAKKPAAKKPAAKKAAKKPAAKKPVAKKK